MNIKSETPAALPGATGVHWKSTSHSVLDGQLAPSHWVLATHFWDPLSHSIQPINELRAGLG